MENKIDMTNRERVFALKQKIQNSDDLSSEAAELEDILSAECAELDKAKVA